MRRKETIKSLELFSGAGGLALGLHASGFDHVALVERNANACATIRRNQHHINSPFHSVSLLEEDIQEIDFQRFGTSINLVAGGPPCQPFSLGGKHRGHGDSRDMFPQAVRAVRDLAPKAFVFENVKGLLRKSFSSYLNYILRQLTYPTVVRSESEDWIDHFNKLEQHHNNSPDHGLEYNVSFKLLNAANFGVPQTRHRVFIVGLRKDLDLQWDCPRETHSHDALLYEKWVSRTYWDRHNIPKNQIPELPKKFEKKVAQLGGNFLFSPMNSRPWRTVRDAIADLPSPSLDPNPQIENHVLKTGAKTYKGHTGSHIDLPSKTLKAGVHGVPGGENMLRYHDGTVRYFSVRESARLQTFPDNHIFVGSWSETMRQLGNAVPVELAKVVGDSIFQQIYENEPVRDYKAVQSA